MDDMVEPQDARDVLPIPRCRQLLGDEATDLTDAEIEEIRRHAHVLAQHCWRCSCNTAQAE